MPLAKQIMGGGFSAGQAKAINGSVASSISAAGTTQGTATALNAGINYIGTAAASSGVILPATEPGDSLVVYNGGANTVTVYPPVGAKVNGLSTNAGVSLGVNTSCLFYCLTSTQWTANLSA